MNHLTKTADGVLHLCESSEVLKGIVLVWTKCEKDVPANKSFKSDEVATCAKCIEATS